MKITKKTLKKFKGKVYDLTVENSHSYNVNGCAVHNSAAGSLVLYLLGVTNKDPIKYELFFERFVSKSRAKKIIDKNGVEWLDGSLCPDVDTDISHSQRHLVIEFIEKQHKGRTAKILTFNSFSSKICIKEAAKYFLGVNEEEANAISSLVPKEHGINFSLEKSLEDEKFLAWAASHRDTYNDALVVEDLNKNYGVHPSGIAIASESISNLVPLQLSNGGELISSYDMNDVADLMVKFDILGLRTLSIADLTCKKVGVNFDQIDDTDPFIYQCLQDFKLPAGLFQISAKTNFEVTRKVKPLDLNELSDVVALARPQSLQFVQDYVNQKNNFEPLNINPDLDNILAKSKNVLIYQEQLMKAANLVFGMSLDDAESLRRVVGKKKVDEVPLWKDKIYKAARERGLSVELADYFWGVVEAAASYGFNKCLGINELVRTKDGEKKMSDILHGDEILAFNIKTGEDHFVKVLNIFDNEIEIYEVEFEDGKTIKCSLEHKFLTKGGEMKPLKFILENSLEIVCK